MKSDIVLSQAFLRNPKDSRKAKHQEDLSAQEAAGAAGDGMQSGIRLRVGHFRLEGGSI
jgi:hypothetical protein